MAKATGAAVLMLLLYSDVLCLWRGAKAQGKRRLSALSRGNNGIATGAALLLYGDVLPLWGGAFARNKRRLQHYLEAAACFLAKDENRLK